MIDELKKYRNNDHFFFRIEDSLEEVCNAPQNQSGVYVIYALAHGRIKPVYVGSSGKLQPNGDFRHEKGGLNGTLINGIQFDEARKKSWPAKMREEEIDALDVYWFVTFDNKNHDLPSYIKAFLLQIHYELYGTLPRWNNAF